MSTAKEAVTPMQRLVVLSSRSSLRLRCLFLVLLTALMTVRSVNCATSQFSQMIRSSQPLSSSLKAQLKAAAEAQEILLNTTRSKEAEAATTFLNNRPLRILPLPQGSRAWCPLLSIDSTGVEHPSPLSLALGINQQYKMKPMTWKMAMADDLPAIAVAGIWWSAKSRPVPVTLITQSSVDRIAQLYSQCKSWRGPLSAVMYMGLLQTTSQNLTTNSISLLKKAASHVSNLFADLEKDEEACKLDVMLVYEVYTEQQAMMLYPINALRNLARLQARTPLLALVDVDMLMGSRLYRDLRADPAFSKMLVDGAAAKAAFVLPAFETFGSTFEAAAIADLLVSRDKQFLMDSMKKHIAGPFDQERFPQGHNWTLFDRWYQTDKAYQVTYGPRYEPWTIVDRKVAPWHDARFRGYGQNKIVHIAHMNSTGFKFVVLGNAFIIHRSHKTTTARDTLVAGKTVWDASLAINQKGDITSIYGHTKSLFDDAQQKMAAGTFKPVLDPATISCQLSLSWWK